jgi:tRNA nucleotidyltransferase (CCA-adding enzyme)
LILINNNINNNNNKKRIGTPTEDAYRRDLTINALFYNINEDKIEDFTGKGL